MNHRSRILSIMERIEELQRKLRPELFVHCDVCDVDVRDERHEHDPEKLAAWNAKHYPPPVTVEEHITSILNKYVGQKIDDCREELQTDLLYLLDDLSGGPVG